MNTVKLTPTSMTIGGEDFLLYAGDRGTSFAAMLRTLWDLKVPRHTTAEQFDGFIETVLKIWCDAGTSAPSTGAAIMAASCGATMAGCLTAALGCMGPYHAPFTDAARFLQQFAASGVPDGSVIVPGFGHPVFQDEDCRIPTLVAAAGPMVGAYYVLTHEISQIISQRHSHDIRANAAGVTAALLLDAGIDPDYADALFVMSRVSGIAAHVVNTRRNGKHLILYKD